MRSLLFIALVLSLSKGGLAFLPRRRWMISKHIPPSRQSFVIVQGSNDEQPDFSGFNPFDYQKSGKSSLTIGYSSGNQISLRKTRMQEIVNELLNVVGQEEEETLSILQESADFLLEPLEDDDAVLDRDSIYTSSMTREERYHAYQKSMEERVASAQNPLSNKF